MGPMAPPSPLFWQVIRVLVSFPLLNFFRRGLKNLLLEEEVVLGEREGISFNYVIIIHGIRAVSAPQLHSSG